jgi:hypothetical protein
MEGHIRQSLRKNLYVLILLIWSKTTLNFAKMCEYMNAKLNEKQLYLRH